jgi:hypothetical protein
MRNQENGDVGSGIKAGDIQGTGIVIGHMSSASVNQFQRPDPEHVAGLVDEFIQLLSRYESSIVDAAGIRESAVAARDELTEPSPRWPIVRGLLKGIAAGVAGVSALSAAVNNIQALILHLPK